MQRQVFHIIGIMSGTSLDGVDLALCRFTQKEQTWHYEIIQAETYSYSDVWVKRLQNLAISDAFSFASTHIAYGHLLGDMVKQFIQTHQLHADYVASHGHTIFHQPENQITVQIGDGASIAATCGIPTICDFRSLDVALSGQGAPLVPIGDKLLFSEYDACLNLGGFGNISFDFGNQRLAFDTSPVNILLNHFALQKGVAFDKNGLIARKGQVNNDVLSALNKLEYYKKTPPKSLGKEWIDRIILPLLKTYPDTTENILRTLVEHITYQIGTIINNHQLKNVLLSGGGAKNVFLVERLSSYVSSTLLTLPDEKIIDYKEALIFAFLGLLRIHHQNNCLQSVTGATKDNCGGCIYYIN
ncbi:MAG: anhydro-N-acetylmuramic acid kinase [Bacteroidales bacterium]|jgi:anhydro-N-acetylmuramic acid kinase|nr:anhydro-N-acetylmuramic acid kinase [Bacteroidales bacterium]MDD2687599.1 anhydro-N-acetylmuramic acid kinase [Bacteroidales bacterium]MDD3330191.1 anhydro-N-acetylmuramic acid kinase [Bacteroidales bacterium]MDD3691062.1 anhydro-N-acetylmuramic acid kinase [Bacteroidales bacterium]MDD4044491.1 anhydro-N-acetylmuramic acid kinase [Bacteroidales bacterium]